MIARLALALYVACCASLAGAQAARPLLVVLPECADAVERRELLDLLHLELHATTALELEAADDLERARSRESLWLEQSCSDRTQATLRYRDPNARESVRDVSLNGVDRALQPRVLALALAELIRSPDVPEHDDPVARHTSWALAVGPSFELWLAEGTLSAGAEVAVDWQRFSFGVLGTLGASRDALGTANYQRLHAFAAFAVARARLGAFGVDAGPRAAAGATFAAATPTTDATAESTIDASSAVSLEAAFSLQLGAAWHARVRADFGYAFGPRFQADDRSLADFSGAYLAASFSIGLALASERR